jgi:KDO2-lipid IV(A) lauroyltransferase
MFLPVLRLIARAPLGWLHGLGAMLGWVVYALSPSYRTRLKENLFASGVGADEGTRRRLLQDTIAEAGKSVTELIAVWFGTEAQVSGLVKCDTWTMVEDARRAGRGIIFLTPHLGCFEISALYGAQRLPITVLYRPPKLRWLEPLMIAGRQRWNARLAPATLNGVRMLYRALRRGEAVGLLPDQAPGAGEGAWADFFGRPAYTMTLVRKLQQATHAAVIMAFAERLNGGRGYLLHLAPVSTDHFDETALNAAVERLVRRCPSQYLWSYNRYKVPAGAPEPRMKAEGGRRKE